MSKTMFSLTFLLFLLLLVLYIKTQRLQNQLSRLFAIEVFVHTIMDQQIILEKILRKLSLPSLYMCKCIWSIGLMY